MATALEPAFDKVFDTQKIYRLMLDAMARPGKILPLPGLDVCPPQGLTGYAAGLALTLLDSETTFAMLPANGYWQDYVAINTGAKSVEPDRAEFLLLDGKEYAPQIAGLSRGNLLSPEGGATLFAQVSGIAANGPGIRMTLAGPGVKGHATVVIDGLNIANLDNILLLNQEYPLGVDTFFTDPRGNLVALPRSTSVRWEVLA